MASLASLLAPLQEADFAVLVAAWLAGNATGAPRRACRLLAARSPGAAEFSEAVLENVYAKLTAADLLRGLAATPSTATVACCSTTCTLCGLDLEIGATCSTYALTWARGLQRVDYERRQCRGCLSEYSSCWRTDRTATMFLCSTPVHLGFLQFLAHPQQDACAFIDCRVLNFCTSLVVRLRASFIGIVQVLQDTLASGLSLPLRKELFQVWMFWRSLAIIPAAELTDVPFVFSHHCRDELRAWLLRAHVLLQERHLRYLAREHWCTVCARCPSVGIDGKMSVSAAVCACLDGPVWTCRRSGLQRRPGCWLPPQRRSRFCWGHAGSGPDLGDLLRPAEHVLRLLPDSAQRRHFCDVCTCTLAADQPLWRCEACDFDVCVACAEDSPGVPSSVVAPLTASATGSIEPVPEDDLNSCGIVKRLPVSRLRRQGGVLTAMLACGRVAHLQLPAGAESATQVTMLLADLRAVRSFNYVIYDDACHLARFVRNRARSSPRSVLCQLAAATYVIDRFHRWNHTACVQETSRHYLPEVKIERHAVLADLNTSWSESWNAWLDVLTPQMRSMDAAALAVYLWLVADLWNTQVIAAQPDAAPAHLPGPLAGRLKRVRGGGYSTSSAVPAAPRRLE